MKNLKIADKVLKDLEKKITRNLLTKLEDIIEEKCEAFFIKHTLPKIEDQGVETEIRLLRNSLRTVENEISLLHEKSDYAIGSLTYISNEYDDFIINSSKLVEENQTLNSSISRLNKNYDQINKRLTTTENDLERLEQYGRRENLEIHGVPFTKNEDTNKIVLKVAEELKVRISDKDISTSHRLFNNASSQLTQNLESTDQYPPIIVRFTNRDKRNELFTKRPKVNSRSARPSFNSNMNSPKFVLKENLTKFRKNLLTEAKKLQQSLDFKFLWTWQGQIFIRKHESSRPIKISSLRDLENLKMCSGTSKFYY